MSRDAVSSPSAPAAIGPYSQAVWVGNLLFISGQTPIDPETGKLVTGDVRIQTARVFDNLEAILSSASLSMTDVMKCNVFLISMDDFSAMNAVYRERFTPPFPARTTVAVAQLPLGAQVEIELIAARS
jgi:2-iminobutanoate/2-iminopropanoate deaminase